MKHRASEIDLHVATKLRELRLLANISQQELGKYLGVSFQQIQKYEKGGNRISSGRLFLLSKLFGVDPSYFFEGLEINKDLSVKKALSEEDIGVTKKAAKFNNTLQQLDDSPVRSKMMGLIKALTDKD